MIWAGEAIEVIAHGDLTTSKVVGRHIEQIKLPASASVAAILRNEHVLFSDKSLVIEPDDHLIIFISNQRDIMAVEKLFQVDFNYLMWAIVFLYRLIHSFRCLGVIPNKASPFIR